jgi:hypothetical protein
MTLDESIMSFCFIIINSVRKVEEIDAISL